MTFGSRDLLQQVRVAFRAGDAAAAVQLARQVAAAGCFQLGADGLLVALTESSDSAVEAAALWAASLRERSWAGDNDLADTFDAVANVTRPAGLKPLPVDLEMLASIRESDPAHGGGRIDVSTGEVWPQAAIEYAVETGEEDDPDDANDDGRWLWVDCEGSRYAYRDMVLFCEWFVDDPGLAGQLEVALNGRGAFGRFKDVLARRPDEIARWHIFSGERQHGRARAWLAAAGYTAVPTQVAVTLSRPRLITDRTRL